MEPGESKWPGLEEVQVEGGWSCCGGRAEATVHVESVVFRLSCWGCRAGAVVLWRSVLVSRSQCKYVSAARVQSGKSSSR